MRFKICATTDNIKRKILIDSMLGINNTERNLRPTRDLHCNIFTRRCLLSLSVSLFRIRARDVVSSGGRIFPRPFFDKRMNPIPVQPIAGLHNVPRRNEATRRKYRSRDYLQKCITCAIYTGITRSKLPCVCVCMYNFSVMYTRDTHH